MQCSNRLLEQRLSEAQGEAKREKARQWVRVKEKTPEIALFLTELNKAMGKPKAVKIVSNGEMILSAGEFDKPKNLECPKYSQMTRENKWQSTKTKK